MKSNTHEYQLLKFPDGQYGLRWRELNLDAWYTSDMRFDYIDDVKKWAFACIEKDNGCPDAEVIPW